MQQNSEGALTPAALCRCLPFSHMLPGDEARPPNQPGGVPAWWVCTSAACPYLFPWRPPLSQFLLSRLRTVYPRVYTWPVVESPLAAARTSDGSGITVWHQLCRRGGDLLANTTLRWLAATPTHLLCSFRPRAAACVSVCACKWIRIGGMRKEPCFSPHDKGRYYSFATSELSFRTMLLPVVVLSLWMEQK